MISTLQRELEESNHQAKNLERNIQLAVPSPEVCYNSLASMSG
jgi:hypothetical protein